MRMSLKLLGGFATLLLAGVSPSVVFPATVPIELTNHTTDNTLYPGDTRADGATSEVAFVNDFDQTLSTKMEVTTGGLSTSKVGPFFYQSASYNPAAPVPIGFIGDLKALTYDWYRESPDSIPKTNAWYSAAIRIYVGIDSPASPTGELIWENAYNESYEFTAADDTWVNNYDIVDQGVTNGSSAGRFYLRADPDGAGASPRQNYGDSSGFTLAQWLAPVTDPTSVRFLNPTWPTVSVDRYVYGVTFSVGSGAPVGVGYVDDVTLFIPEPASLSLLAAGGLLMLRRRRA